MQHSVDFEDKKNPAEAGLNWVLGESAASVIVRSTEHDSDDSQIDGEV